MNDADRRAAVFRKTAEMTIDMTLTTDGNGGAVADTDIGFFDHMLETFVKHDLFDLAVQCNDDLHIDDHYIVEDVTIAPGEAFTEALGDRYGIVCYADHKVPLDETVASVIVNVSGRPSFEFSGDLSQPYVGEFTSHMAEHFIILLAMNVDPTSHAGVEGGNTHHKVKALFKTFVRLLDDTARVDPRHSDTPSTKGKL